MKKFVENIIAFSLKNHVLVLFLTAILLVAGLVSFFNTQIEAYPDVTNTRARVIPNGRDEVPKKSRNL